MVERKQTGSRAVDRAGGLDVLSVPMFFCFFFLIFRSIRETYWRFVRNKKQ
jgi:hypothetical protein